MTNNNLLYQNALEQIHEKLLKNGKKFDSVSPMHTAVDGIYPISPGDEWTDSFYVGMLWLDWVRTKDENIRENIKQQMWEFGQRLKQNRGMGNHDIGFLYILSAVAGYKLTKCEKYKDMAVEAAKYLVMRYQPKAEFIQAWGDPGDPICHHLIIDCMLNIPLLYWVARQTGDETFFEIAYKHAKTTSKVIFREDASTHHTYYFDYETGKPLYGKTSQGAGDNSAWARGQAWAIYGFALSYRYTRDETFLVCSKKAADYFLAHLPADEVCYWDLCFAEGAEEPRDSSAAAIAASGLLELAAQSGEQTYQEAAERIVTSLCKHYMSPTEKESLLDHGVYSKPAGRGVDEACIWGDYYFMEALCRLADEEKFVLFW